MYIGVDYHKKYSIATMMDERGKILKQVRLNNDPQTLSRFAEALPSGSKIALEATGSWYYFYELLENRCPDIYLAHPLKRRAIAEARIKTDRIDSNHTCTSFKSRFITHILYPTEAYKGHKGDTQIQGIISFS